MAKRRAPRRVNHLCLAKMVAYLQECPSTVAEAAEASGLSVSTARRVLLALHAEKASRVVGWEQDTLGRYTTKVYLLQRGEDAAKPEPARTRNVCKRAQRDRRAQMAIQNAIAGVAQQ
jgi:predicted ArsR family transcriptional regulator